jgi:farnesyl-diphosphate farnesyltransferase
MMRAITATEMRSGVAARMTIGRRWLARQGVPRLLDAEARGALKTSELAGLLIVLLGGTGWGGGPIVGLEDGIAALLRLQTKKGGFAPSASDFEACSGGDVRATALSCRALAAARRAPAASGAPPSETRSDPDRLDVAISQALTWLRETTATDGALGGESENEHIARTACSLEVVASEGGAEAEVWVDTTARWLTSRLFSRDLPSGPGFVEDTRLLAMAMALRAVLASTLSASSQEPTRSRRNDSTDELGTSSEAIDRVVWFLGQQVVQEGTTRGGGVDSPARWEVWCEILEALALYETLKRQNATCDSVPRGGIDGTLAADGARDRDWEYCRKRLAEVSRSFSQPIALLPHHLEIAVTLAYLLCRVADSVEDHAAVPQASRAPLMARLIDVLTGREDPETFARAFESVIPAESVPGDPELVLTCNVPRVMRVLRAQPARTQAMLVRWIVEMARGMALYTFRQPGPDGIIALDTVPDLERYCYFVAGTVGHLLTDLFLDELGDEATPELALSLRIHAEPFGMGLQLVNILKDLTDDQARRWSFIPRTLCAARSLAVAELTDPERRQDAHAAVAPLFDLARGKLDDGMKYALAIPARHAGLRRFCLLPLWMAARTLVQARGGDAMFTPGAAVKIPRDEVAALSIACVSLSSDDDELRVRYGALWTETTSVALPRGRSTG